MDSLKSLHDKLLEQMPESAAHDSAECPICTPQNTHENGGQMSDKTFTEDQVDALVQAKVAEATASIQKELEDLKVAEETVAVEARIAEAKAESDVKVADLQAQLDAAVIQTEQITTAHNELLAWLTSEKETAEKATEMEAIQADRLTKVAEVVSFPEEYVQTNASRWAAMSEEDFEATLADYKAVSEKAAANAGAHSVPNKTALTANRDTDLNNSKGFSATREVLRMRDVGVDPRELTR